jgi:ABC-type bacteriocin/lantibiotic exporter with double-glycine peptidase domain
MLSPDDPATGELNSISNRIEQNPSFISKPKSKIRSTLEIWILSLGIGTLVFVGALALQWVIYDRLLHEDGLRLVGSLIAGCFAALLVHGFALQARNTSIAELRRIETIALMNHHIRNSLQAIVFCSGNSESANAIRESVNRIAWVLSDVLPTIQDGPVAPHSFSGETANSVKSKATSSLRR